MVKRALLSRPIVLAAALAGLLVGSLPSLAAETASAGNRPGTATARHRQRSMRIRRRARSRAATRNTASSAAISPSGVPMPVGNIPGWRQVFADDFTGATLDTSRWRLYWGQPGGDPGGLV